MHLNQPGFTYSTCGPFTKNKERIQNFKETGDSKYIFKNVLDKVCFQDDMVYGDFKDSPKRTAANKFLRDKAFNIAKYPKCDGYRRELTSMDYKYLDKKTAGSGIKSIPQNQQLSEELHKLKKKSIFNIQRQYLGC